MERTTRTSRDEQRRLARWLAGELAPEEDRRLRRRLDEDPALAREAERLRRTWDALEEPPAASGAVPPGFSGRVMARVREEAFTPRLSWSAAPGWARAVGAAALVVGLFLGAGLGGGLPGTGVPVPGPAPEAPSAEGVEAVAAVPNPAVRETSASDSVPPAAPEPAAPVAEDAAADPGTRVADAQTAPDDLEDAWQELYYGEGSGDDFGSLGDSYVAALAWAGEGEGT